MLKSTLVSLVLVLAVAAGPVLAADPSVDQIYQALRSGHPQEAQQMIDQVLTDHPQSARAHYVAAEVAAKRGNFGIAREQLATARRLAPTLPFADRYSVQELDRELSQRSPGSVVRRVEVMPPVEPVRHGSSVVWWVLIGGGILLLWIILSRRAAYYRGYPGPVPGPMPGPMGPMGGGGMMPGGMMGGGMAGGGGGSGILGGLASGLAIGAGVAAGEELVHHVLDGNRGGVIPSAGASEVVDYPDNTNADMGGNDFGVSDSGSWDDGGGGGGGGDDWN